MTLSKRKLGNQGLEVSAVGLGCMGMSQYYGLANEKQVKPGQIALAWLLHKGNNIVPIPGTKHQKYLEENIASDTIKLDATEMNLLDDALAMGKVSGNRYPDWVMETIDR